MTLTSAGAVRPFAQLCCVVLAAVGIPAVLCRSDFLAERLRLKDPELKPVMRASGGVQDAASGQAILKRDRPDWVLIGNSVLNCRVEEVPLEEISGHQVYKLSFSGTKSAMWFLMLKGIVAPSKVKPKCVTVFFRDRDLTQPTLRAQKNEEMIERLKGRDQPEWDLVMADYEAARATPWERLSGRVGEDLGTLLPGEKLQDWARGKVQKTAFSLSSFGAPKDYRERRAERNSVLSLDHQRKGRAPTSSATAEAADLQDEAAEELEAVASLDFNPSPEASFLPHMVALSRLHGFKLHFHRVKVNPDFSAPESEWERTLPAYLGALRSYLEGEGCFYTDETSEGDIGSEFYVDLVHIRTEPATQEAYLKIFWRHVGPLIDRLLGPSGTPSQTD